VRIVGAEVAVSSLDACRFVPLVGKEGWEP
jgi:hypothetical protein